MVKSLTAKRESFALRQRFAISRGSKTSADVISVELSDGQFTGRGECVPYARYGESMDSVLDAINSVQSTLNRLSRQSLLKMLPAGAARNAIDCALWDLEAHRQGCRAWELAGIERPQAMITAYTLSLDTPEVMHQAAVDHAARPLLKLKLAGEGDLERVAAVRQGAPDATIIVDANEGWTLAQYNKMVPLLLDLGVSMIEQPLPADSHAVLASVDKPITLCADESCHDTATLAGLAGLYDMVNIKLDKTGGLTEALVLRAQALDSGFEIMVGCMVATSLAMAPATLVASGASVVDLDGPLLLAEDREWPLDYADFSVAAPDSRLWG